MADKPDEGEPTSPSPEDTKPRPETDVSPQQLDFESAEKPFKPQVDPPNTPDPADQPEPSELPDEPVDSNHDEEHYQTEDYHKHYEHHDESENPSDYDHDFHYGYHHGNEAEEEADPHHVHGHEHGESEEHLRATGVGAAHGEEHGHEDDPHHGERAVATTPPPSEPESDSLWGDDEEGGGPIKSFLEHLEDLRWVIIRCVAALALAMVVCLVAGNYAMKLLKEPLEQARQLAGEDDAPKAIVVVGESRQVVKLSPDAEMFGMFPLDSNRAVKVEMVPFQITPTNFVMAFHQAPMTEADVALKDAIPLQPFGPIGAFVVALKIALFGGLGLASPFILFFIGQFVVPALHTKERKYLYRALFIGTLLFLCGVLFCYFFMLQVALNAAVKFAAWMGFETEFWRAEEYIGFVVKFMIGMGISFELPVVLLTLVKLELLDYQRLVKFRPYWVIMNMALAAMLTPPDPFSMLLMALPLQVLFELSIFIAWIWHRRDLKRAAATEAAGE